ncbi:MAG TPA: vanadium-dependent haloperoxidase [Candidatus Binatus sp.]|nr:vanadium-dependent haloperoxidase [Candidatus Binatus sp.]
MRSGLVAALLVLAAPLQVRADGPSRAQQRCIVALNRAGTKMAVANAHAFVGCAKRIALGRTPVGQTLTECAASVAGARIARIESAAARVAKRVCATPPSFGPTSAAGVAAAFAAMLHPEAVFGPTLISVQKDRAGAACQAAIVKGIVRAAEARALEFTACEAAGLRAGRIASADDFAPCLDSDAHGRIARALRAAQRLASARCRSIPITTACPDECAVAPLDGLFDCLGRWVGYDFCLAAAAAGGVPRSSCQRYQSVARQWDEEILEAIRHDTPRPTVHARNLFHLSAAMWDAWRAYGGGGKAFLTDESHASSDPEGDRATAISFAAYRLLSHRYALSVNAASTQAHLDSRMATLGYDKNFTSIEGDMPAAVGNRIGNAMIAFGGNDGANEDGNYADASYAPVNDSLVVKEPGTVMNDPNRWQPLALAIIITQNGITLPDKVQSAIGMRWNSVTPFALTRSDPSAVYIDPGPPPTLSTTTVTSSSTTSATGASTTSTTLPCETDPFKQAAVRVIELSSELTPDDGVTLDISPGAYGNNSLGRNDGRGRSLNPITGQPYAPEVVKRGDFGRVLAEFWADGPNSETPPGHWNVIANAVGDNPALDGKRIGGTGPVVSDLEWDVKVYLAVNGAMHDAAVVAWGLKRKYDSVRPISMIRYMGGLGQCTDPSGTSYNPAGLPQIPGLIEVITPASSAPGQRHEALASFVGEVAILAWPGGPPNPTTQHSGVAWIRAKTWVPYQKSTFVTPAFPAYTSGHSTFSRAAAEVLARFTGSEFFPGGLGEFVAPANHDLTFELGPSTDVRLQWATYYDASDQAGQSRLWGGIHISEDDFTGRITGSEVGIAAYAKATAYFAGTR